MEGQPMFWTPKRSRIAANWFSALVGVAVLVFCLWGIGASGGWAIFRPHEEVTQQEIVTVITSRNEEAQETTYAGSSDESAQPTPPDSKTTTVKPRTEQTTTTTTPIAVDNTLLGRAFQNPFVFLMLEFLLAIFTAFLTAAATQRVILGSYGIKIGSLEIDPIPPVTEAEANKADVISADEAQAVAGERGRAPWSILPPELLGNDRLEVINRREILEIGLRRAALTNRILSDDLEYVIKNLYKANDKFTHEAAISCIDLLKLGDRVLNGAEVSHKVARILLGSYEKALDVVIPLTT